MYERDILKDFNDYYNEAYPSWDVYTSEATDDLNCFLGRQWEERERQALAEEGRNAFVINFIRRNVNALTGYQKKNRLSSIVTPIESSDQKTCDQLSQLLLYAMSYGNGYNVISDCFAQAVKTGISLMTVYKDYTSDPINGDIAFATDSYRNFLPDPYFTKLDFSDAAYVLKRRYLSVNQVMALLPKYRDDIEDLANYDWAADNKFFWLPYQRYFQGSKVMAYTEMYTQDYKSADTLVDIETGEFLDWEDGTQERFNELKIIYPQLELVKRQKKIIKKCVIVNDKYIETEINPDGLNEYPFAPCIAYFEPECADWNLKIQSAVRCMKDPQRLLNRIQSKMVDTIESQLNSGYIATEGSVKNKDALFQTGQGKVIWRDKNAPPGAIERIPPPQLPPAFFQLYEQYKSAVVDVFGLTDAALGQAENANESGILSMLRQGAAWTLQQDIMDNLRFFQKTISQKVVRMIQEWTPEKVKKIINEDPSDFFYNKYFIKYDCVVTEGLLTDTQRQQYFRQLIDLKQLGEPIPPLALTKAAPLQGKSELIEDMEKFQQQQQQAAIQQQQSESAKEQAQADLFKSQSIANIASAKERFTRSIANMGLEDERASSAVEDRANAVLLRAKAAKEIEDMDVNRLIKLLKLFNLLEEKNKQKEEEIKQDNVAVTVVADKSSKLPSESNMLGAEGIAQLTNQNGGFYA